MYDYIFCGGGLSALLLLHAMKEQLSDKKILVLENDEYSGDAYLSYWSRKPTVFDDYRIASWQKTYITGKRKESTDDYTIGLLKKANLINGLRSSLSELPITWSGANVHQIQSENNFCRVYTDMGVEKAKIVFDSCVNIKPAYPDPDKSFTLSGYELIVESDIDVFDENVANFYIKLPRTGVFGYMLPLSKTSALLESANFQPRHDDYDRGMLLDFLAKTYPKAKFVIKHEQLGIIPLGNSPTITSGNRHILIGQKRGLVKISAGYGIMNIYRESQKIANDLVLGKIPATTRKRDKRYELMDNYFMKLVQSNPKKADRLMRHTLQKQPITTSFALIDESLSSTKLALTMIKSIPYLF